MTGNWKLKTHSIIHFSPFYLNLDQDIAKYPELVQQNDLGDWTGLLTKKNNNVQFCIGYDLREKCYKKISSY